MKTLLNSFGEEYTTWQSHKHPENENFMQIVYWHVWVKDGKTTVCYTLGSNSKSYFIYDISKSEAIAKFTDNANNEITDEEFENWLKIK